MKCLKSQEMRKLAPELDPLRIGTGWKPEELAMPQVIIESTAGDSHPGSGHLHILVDEVKKGIAEAGGHGAKYFCTRYLRRREPGNRWNQLQPCKP